MNPMTQKQHAFITSLLKDREPNLDAVDGLVFERYMDFLDGTKFISTKEASLLIDWLKGQPYKAKPQTNAAGAKPEPGVYVIKGEWAKVIIKLQENKAKTNMYTMRWVETKSEYLNENDDHVKGKWEYAPEFKNVIEPEHRMTMDEAKAFTLKYGQCAKCGHKLKAAKSVEKAIGPVCGKYFSAAA